MPDETTEVEFDATEVTPMFWAESVLSGTWKANLRDEEGNINVDVSTFRENFNDFVTAVNTIRESFDKACYEAYENGTFTYEELKSIRAPRSADAATPGRKPVEKSLKDKLLKK